MKVTKETYSRKGPLALLFAPFPFGVLGFGIYGLLANLRPSDAGMILFVAFFLFGGMFFILQSIFMNATDCYYVALTEDALLGRAPFKKYAIKYADIVRMDITPLMADRLRITAQDGTRLCIDGLMREYGDFVEALLPLAQNITYLDLGKLTSKKAAYRRIWGKEPDEAIIKAAMTRVAENRGTTTIAE